MDFSGWYFVKCPLQWVVLLDTPINGWFMKQQFSDEYRFIYMDFGGVAFCKTPPQNAP